MPSRISCTEARPDLIVGISFILSLLNLSSSGRAIGTFSRHIHRTIFAMDGTSSGVSKRFTTRWAVPIHLLGPILHFRMHWPTTAGYSFTTGSVVGSKDRRHQSSRNPQR